MLEEAESGAPGVRAVGGGERCDRRALPPPEPVGGCGDLHGPIAATLFRRQERNEALSSRALKPWLRVIRVCDA